MALLSVTLAASRHLHAPRAAAWSAFCRATGWREWSRGGQRATLNPLGLRLRVTVRVVEAQEGHRVAWRGQGLGIQSHHEFSFVDQAGGCLASSRETLSGWMLLLLRPFYSPRRLAVNAQAWLAELAVLAEGRPPGRAPDRVTV